METVDSFSIGDCKIGPNEPPFIVAELSANHNGSLTRAIETMDAAKRCGANAIKLQTYTAETITIDCDDPDFIIKGGLWDGYKLFDLYKEAGTPYEWHKPLFDHARKIGLTIFSTPFDETAVDLLESLESPAYKIASFEMVDLPLVQYVARTGKPMIISTGMASEEEINETVQTARDSGCKNLILLHCISNYPTPIDQANLRKIPKLASRFKTLSGLSDHTLGTNASIAAVALGSCMIEKHFTLSREDKGPDSQFSIEPLELERLCRDAKEAWLGLGDAGFDRENEEEANKAFRRSIYFVKDLPAGHILGPTDIRRIRPGKGLAPKYFQELIGRRLKASVARGTPANLKYFA